MSEATAAHASPSLTLPPIEPTAALVSALENLAGEVRATREASNVGAHLEAITEKLGQLFEAHRTFTPQTIRESLAVDFDRLTHDIGATKEGITHAGREFTALERAFTKFADVMVAVNELLEKFEEENPAKQAKDLSGASKRLGELIDTVAKVGEDMLTRLNEVPDLPNIDPNEIRRLETAREALYDALNDVVVMAQLKTKMVDRAHIRRSLAIFTVFGLSLGLLVATGGFFLLKPGVDTRAEAWGRHLLADKNFAACLDQSQAPTGPAACSIRFRPDPAAAAPQKR